MSKIESKEFKIIVQNLKFRAIIGILPFEREVEQDIEISMKISADEFVDYAKICEDLKEIFIKNKFGTIEDSIKFCEDFFVAKFDKVSYFYIKVLKPNILENCVVGCEFEMFY